MSADTIREMTITRFMLMCTDIWSARVGSSNEGMEIHSELRVSKGAEGYTVNLQVVRGPLRTTQEKVCPTLQEVKTWFGMFELGSAVARCLEADEAPGAYEFSKRWKAEFAVPLELYRRKMEPDFFLTKEEKMRRRLLCPAT